MKFICKCNDVYIMTDDYSDTEIKNGLHFKNLLSDMRKSHFPYLNVYDENMHFITRLSNKH